MYCKNCGKELRENAKFCTSCGKKVVNEVNTTEEVIENNVESKVTKEDVIKTIKEAKTITEKNKKSKLPIILIMLLILVIGGYFVYKIFFANKDNVVKGLINGMYDTFEETISKVDKYNFKNESILINGDFAIESNINGLKDLNGIKINYTLGTDLKNKKLEFGAGLEENSKSIIDAMMYILEDEAYISLKDYYKYLIKLENSDMDFESIFESESKIKTEDIKFIVKSYKDALIDSLDMNEFIESKDKLEINDKEIDVTKLEYEVTTKKIDKLSRKIVKKILKNKKFISKLSEIFETDEENIKSSLEDYLNSKELDDDTVIGNINIYVTGMNNDFVGMDIKSDNVNIKIRKDGNETTVDIKSENTNISFTIIDEKDSFTIEIKTGEFKGKIILKQKEIDKNNKEGKLEINIDVNGEKLTIKSNYKIKKGSKIANVDLKNAKKIEDITQEELEEIQNKLEEKLKNSKLYNLINKYSQSVKKYNVSAYTT